MSLIIDSSVTLSWFFEDERTPQTIALLRQVEETGAIVPSLWRLEVANGLEMALRRGRITGAYRDASLTDLAALNIALDPDTGDYAWTTTLRLAERFRLTLYDAAYLELAQRLSLPLATLDEALRTAASGLGVPLLATD